MLIYICLLFFLRTWEKTDIYCYCNTASYWNMINEPIIRGPQLWTLLKGIFPWQCGRQWIQDMTSCYLPPCGPARMTARTLRLSWSRECRLSRWRRRVAWQRWGPPGDRSTLRWQWSHHNSHGCSHQAWILLAATNCLGSAQDHIYTNCKQGHFWSNHLKSEKLRKDKRCYVFCKINLVVKNFSKEVALCFL